MRVNIIINNSLLKDVDWIQKMIGEWWFKTKPEKRSTESIYKLVRKILKEVKNYEKLR